MTTWALLFTTVEVNAQDERTKTNEAIVDEIRRRDSADDVGSDFWDSGMSVDYIADFNLSRGFNSANIARIADLQISVRLDRSCDQPESYYFKGLTGSISDLHLNVASQANLNKNEQIDEELPNLHLDVKCWAYGSVFSGFGQAIKVELYLTDVVAKRGVKTRAVLYTNGYWVDYVPPAMTYEATMRYTTNLGLGFTLDYLVNNSFLRSGTHEFLLGAQDAERGDGRFVKLHTFWLKKGEVFQVAAASDDLRPSLLIIPPHCNVFRSCDGDAFFELYDSIEDVKSHTADESGAWAVAMVSDEPRQSGRYSVFLSLPEGADEASQNPFTKASPSLRADTLAATESILSERLFHQAAQANDFSHRYQATKTGYIYNLSFPNSTQVSVNVSEGCKEDNLDSREVLNAMRDHLNRNGIIASRTIDYAVERANRTEPEFNLYIGCHEHRFPERGTAYMLITQLGYRDEAVYRGTSIRSELFTLENVGYASPAKLGETLRGMVSNILGELSNALDAAKLASESQD